MSQVHVKVVMEPDEAWVVIPQGYDTILLNRAQCSQLSAAQELITCVLAQMKAQHFNNRFESGNESPPSNARSLGDGDVLVAGGGEEEV